MPHAKTVLWLLLPLLLLSACRERLADTRWVLTEIVGKEIPVSGRAYMRLHKDGEKVVAGSGGCNRFSGPYTLDGNALHVGPLIATRMACPDMREERAFFTALQTADAYRLEQGTLVLSRGGAPLLRFRAEAPAGGAE